MSLTTVALLLNNGCSTTVHDFKFCGLIPIDENHASGAGGACDNFLSKEPKTYDQAGLDVLFLSWVKAGDVVECTTSTAVSQLKDEIEKFCSQVKCSEELLAAVDVLKKVIANTELSRSLRAF